MPFPFAALAPFAGAALDAISTHSANRASMRFNERMASTQWQRGTKDMLAAGINPMLAVSQGGNSAPTVQLDPVTRNTASTALSVQAQRAQLEQIDAQTELLREQGAKTKAEAVMLSHEIPWSSANVYEKSTQLREQTQIVKTQAKKLEQELNLAAEQAREKKLTNDQLEKIQPVLLQYQRLLTQAEALGIPVKQVEAKFAEEMGDNGKILRFIKEMIR